MHNSDGTWTEKGIYSFSGGSDVDELYGAVLCSMPPATPYGTTVYGGAYSYGTNYDLPAVFELSPSSGGWIYTTFHTFNCQCPYGPTGALIMDNAGSLYGATSGGDADAMVLSGGIAVKTLAKICCGFPPQESLLCWQSRRVSTGKKLIAGR